MKKLVILFIIFSSCVAKKRTIEVKEFVLKDTVAFEKEVVFLPPIKETVLVEKVCDSLGNLKQFEKEIVTPKAKVLVQSVKGNLQVNVDIDSIVDSRVADYRKQFTKQTEIKEVEIVKYKTPLWIIFALIASVLLNILLFKIRLT